MSARESESEACTGYEYRIMGSANGDWRVTEWDDRETAVRRYKNVSWGLIAIERRESGDTSTLQRKPTPDTDEWKDVTDDMIHVELEVVGDE